MKVRIFFFLLCFLYSFTNIYSNISYRLKLLTVQQGLSEGRICDMAELPDGRVVLLIDNMLEFYDGITFKTVALSGNKSVSMDDVRMSLYVDNDFRIWIRNGHELYIYNIQKESFEAEIRPFLEAMGVKEKLKDMAFHRGLFFAEYASKTANICYVERTGKYYETVFTDLNEIFFDKEICYMIHNNEEVAVYIPGGKYERNDIFRLPRRKLPDETVRIVPYDNGVIACMMMDGLWIFSSQKGKWEKQKLPLEPSELLTSLMDGGEKIVVCTSHGRMIEVDIQNSNHKVNTLVSFDNNRVQSNIVKILKNRDNGNIWFCFHDFLGFFSPSYNRIIDCSTSLPHNMIINSIVETDDRYYYATMKGVYSSDLGFEEFEFLPQPIGNSECRAVFLDSDGCLWIESLRKGLFCLKDEKIRKYDVGDLNIREVFEDYDKNIWVGIYDGLLKLDRKTGEYINIFDNHKKLKTYFYPLYVDNWDNNTLICVCKNGFFLYDRVNDKVYTSFEELNDRRLTFSNCYFKGAYKDSRGMMWLVGSDNVVVLGNSKDECYVLDSENFSRGVRTGRICEDAGGNMCLGGYGDIYSIMLKKNNYGYDFDINLYNNELGIPNSPFYCVFLNKDKELLLAGNNALFKFYTSNSFFNLTQQTPILTQIHMNGKNLNTDLSPVYTDKIDVDYGFYDLEFTVSGVNFAVPSLTEFKYILEGFDKEWKYASSRVNDNTVISYPSLPSGKYTLVVYALNEDKVLSTTPLKLEINVIPPFYLSSLAVVLYIISILLIILLVMRYIYSVGAKRENRRRQEEIRKKETELNNMRFRFFTNISHEFRTPLTLIQAPLRSLIKRTTDEDVKKQLDLIMRNAENLNQLVDQLLDFRRIEAKEEKLHLSRVSVDEFSRTVTDSFKEFSIERNISLELRNETHNMYINIDAEKMGRVMYNLLSNAFKFTEEGGFVTITFDVVEENDGNYLCIKVKDTGRGIPQNQIQHIFDRFYQVEGDTNTHSGSGIGLHIVKSYVDMHNGRISVDSTVGEGTEFTVLLPVNPLYDNENIVEQHVIIKKYPYNILVVEDNKDMNGFICSELGKYYNVFSALNAVDAEKIALSENIHLIVTDYMMPYVDGLEFCRKIKTQLLTSHIPVILLTAKGTDDIKLHAYTAGVDSYISKPFAVEVLLARIRNLIELREQKIENFRKEVNILPEGLATSKADEKFLKDTLKCIEENLEDSDFSIDDLSVAMNMSRSTLYRKIQSLTGDNIVTFIRNVRLKKAISLLNTGEFTISEVAYKVGFSTPRYFSKTFKEVYGVLPSQYEASGKNQQG